MIKFRVTYPDGTHGYGFGLSAENIRRLKDDQPILINLSEMGLEGKAFIFYRETEADLVEWSRQFMDHRTVIHETKEGE